MKKNELRISINQGGWYTVGIWTLRQPPYRDWLITGSTGETKLKALWNLIKWLYRYDNLKELFYIRSIKNEWL